MTTEEKVKQAFLRLMRQSAYTDITVTALAKQAGIDRRTFYRHFASVASVLAAFEGDLVKTFCQVLTGKPFAAGRVIAAINQNITHYYDFFDDLAMTQKHSFFIEHCVNIIAAIFAGALQPAAGMSTTAFHLQIRFVAAGIVRVYLDWLHDGQPVSLAALTAQLNVMVNAELAGMPPKMRVQEA